MKPSSDIAAIRAFNIRASVDIVNNTAIWWSSPHISDFLSTAGLSNERQDDTCHLTMYIIEMPLLTR